MHNNAKNRIPISNCSAFNLVTYYFTSVSPAQHNFFQYFNWVSFKYLTFSTSQRIRSIISIIAMASRISKVIKRKSFIISIGRRTFRYREIIEELCQTPDPEIIDLTKEDDGTSTNSSQNTSISTPMYSPPMYTPRSPELNQNINAVPNRNYSPYAPRSPIYSPSSPLYTLS